MYGLKKDWLLEPKARVFCLEDYEGATNRWCPGCGDSAVLGAVQRLCRDKQLPPEKTVVVSGIGCSSRFPHYMKTYGFHGLHGRALPVATGVRARRPDLHMFVATGDGDCTAIGAGHWVHAIRYNMNMTVMLLDNNIYGLTKKQTSPTTRKGEHSNTHPYGALLSPLNTLQTTLSITNASFVAQTVDWNPAHLYNTLKAAHEHQGLSFIRILQRCPHFTKHIWESFQHDPNRIKLLTHENGIEADEMVRRIYKNQAEHDPSNLDAAMVLTRELDPVPIGLLYRNEDAERYDLDSCDGIDLTAEERVRGVQKSLDRFMI